MELAPKTNIVHGTLTTPGNPDTQGSYWSELAGISGIVTTILIISKFYQITQGTVLVICNGESTLKCCFKQQTCNPIEKHFDIVHAICTIMHKMSLTMQWEHVWGHQDKAKLEKSDKACWNAAMDMAAKNHWEKIQNQHGPTVLIFREEPWRLWLGQDKVSLHTNNIYSNTYAAVWQDNTGAIRPGSYTPTPPS